MKLTKAVGPFCLALFLVAWMLVPRAQASVLAFDTSLLSPGVVPPGVPAPGWYNGTSPSANTNFAVDTEVNLELGLRVATRFVGPIDPGPNSNVYRVFPSAGPLATWNFEFSVDTRAGGGTAALNAFLYSLTIQDLTTGINAPPFDPVHGIPDDATFGPTGIIQPARPTPAPINFATQWGAQNSENLGFGFLPGFNATAPDLYEFTLSATTLSGAPVASVSVFASTVPEPGTMILFGAALIGIASLARKRSRRI